MNAELAVVDMAGTTVSDGGLVEEAFTAAISAVGVPERQHPEMLDHVRRTMGQSKITVFRALLDEERAQRANREFERAYDQHIAEGRCTPIPGAEPALRRLRDAGVKVALTTGFAAATQRALLDALGWQELVDLALAPAEGRRGRPFPDLVLTAVLRLGITDVRNVAVVGDTPLDMTAGTRAGASVIAGVLTGTGTAVQLHEAGATDVLDSVADLPPLLEAHQ